MEKFATMPSFYKPEQSGEKNLNFNSNSEAPQNEDTRNAFSLSEDGNDDTQTPVHNLQNAAAENAETAKAAAQPEQAAQGFTKQNNSRGADVMLSLLSNHAKRISKINRGK